MLNIAIEREHLAKAEQDLVEGEGRIRRQVATIETLRANGHSIAEAEALLVTLRQTLRAWQDHRDEIALTITRLESGAF